LADLLRDADVGPVAGKVDILVDMRAAAAELPITRRSRSFDPGWRRDELASMELANDQPTS